MKLGITMLIHNKDDIEFVTEFPCFLGHPVPSIYVTFVTVLGVHTIFSTYDKSDNGSGTKFNEFEIDSWTT